LSEPPEGQLACGSLAPAAAQAERQPGTVSRRVTADPGETEGRKSRTVVRWHTSLRAVAVVNVALWALTAASLTSLSVGNGTTETQLLLSAAYVAGCAYRSFLPVIDIPRLVLVDSPLSSVLVGRSVATVAELCFAAQWALILHHLASLSASAFVQAVSASLVPLILLAEGFSWYAVLTTQQRAHAVENSLWGIAAALVVVGMLVIGTLHAAGLYWVTIAGGMAYVAFIFVYDVPMYWARWREDQASGRRYLSLADGLVDVARRRDVSYRWSDWKNEVAWMSLYFTLGVWSSIWLVHAAAEVARNN